LVTLAMGTNRIFILIYPIIGIHTPESFPVSEYDFYKACT
jgi:hypothetical protein